MVPDHPLDAPVQIHGKRRSLGYHTSEDAAARAFDEAARETKDQARIKLNFPKRGEAVAAGATSRFRGVSWLKARAKWHAQITINKKQVRTCAFVPRGGAQRLERLAAQGRSLQCAPRPASPPCSLRSAPVSCLRLIFN